MTVGAGRTEIEQSSADAIGLPILVAVVVVAIVVRQLFPPGPDLVVMVVCAVVAVLDVGFAYYILRKGRATFVVTADEITFTGVRWGGHHAALALRRAPGSTLSFRLQRNGITAGQFQYLLKLRDETTGQEVPAGTFGRRKVRQACESQGWTFT
jgi:hypothetical protein